jgi:hypothetical protein
MSSTEDDHVLKVQLDDAVAVFMLGAEDDPELVENVDVEVIMSDGSRWAATFISLMEIGRIMERWEITGEHLAGAYLRVPDLIVVKRGGLDNMVELLRSILTNGDPATALVRVDIED